VIALAAFKAYIIGTVVIHASDFSFDVFAFDFDLYKLSRRESCAVGNERCLTDVTCIRSFARTAHGHAQQSIEDSHKRLTGGFQELYVGERT